MKTIAVALALAFVCVSNAQNQTVISGRLLGYDGKPMIQTDIHRIRFRGDRATSTSHAAADGSFQIAVAETGVVIIKFAGLFHLSQDIRFLLRDRKPVSLELRLGTYRFTRPAQVRMIGTFGNWDRAKFTTMKNEADGTFSAEYVDQKEPFGYQLLGVESSGRSINGTQSETFEYDGDGDYRSYVSTLGGKVKIVFDPLKMLSSAAPPKISFADSLSRVARYARILWNRENLPAEIQVRTAGIGSGLSGMTPYQEMISAEKVKLADQIRKEEDGLIRRAMLWNYVRLSSVQNDTAIAALFVREAHNAIRELSGMELLEFLPSVGTAGAIMGFNSLFASLFSALLDSVKDSNIKRGFALGLLDRVRSMSNGNLMHTYYNLVIGKFADDPSLKELTERYGSGIQPTTGDRVPSFIVTSIDDSTVILSDFSLRGRWYLIDFWATWSDPCRSEVLNLQKVYDKFRVRNFEIVSFSLDAHAEDVKKFRAGSQRMPWLHAFITPNRRVQEDFSVVTLPRRYLVDPTGKIVLLNGPLLGPTLEATVAQYLYRSRR